jgi:hypothetical protein
MAAIALAIVATSCTPPTEPGPVLQPPAIQSITPSTGPMAGGTSVTIRGLRFASGATMTIGGRPATDLNVQSGDVITARTPAGTTAVAVDVVVTVNGLSGTLAAGFRYESPAPTAAPVIRSIAGRGRRPAEPPNFADHGETIQMTAVVEDADTPAAQLVFEWQACGGTFTGTGAQVDWQAPTTGVLPPLCNVELAVSDGSNRVTQTVGIRLHNSVTEVRDLAVEFLTEFADSSIPAATTVRNFSDSCAGKADELKDVTNNRNTRKINSHTYGTPTVSVTFGGVCAYRSRSADACFSMPVEWRSTILPGGAPEIARGTSHITAIYANSRWWLCNSDYQPAPGTSLTFMR